MTDNVDPYRYGRPPEPVYTAGPTGKRIVSASWGLLKQDRQLLWLPIMSTVAGLLAAAILFVPGFALGDAIAGQRNVGVYVGGVLAALGLSAVSIYFQAALVIGAYQRADGGTPTLAGVLREAWTLKRQIVSWAVVTTTVGAVIRAVEQRLGILGKILGFLGGIAWAVATFLAVPVLVAERVGPITAVKRSAQLIRDTWGTSLRTTLRLGFAALLLFLPLLALAVAGIVLIAGGLPVPGVALLIVSVIGLVVLGSIYGAVTAYARAMIYRFAVGRQVPGMPADMLAGAFVAKRRRRR